MLFCADSDAEEVFFEEDEVSSEDVTKSRTVTALPAMPLHRSSTETSQRCDSANGACSGAFNSASEVYRELSNRTLDELKEEFEGFFSELTDFVCDGEAAEDVQAGRSAVGVSPSALPRQRDRQSLIANVRL